MVEADIWSLGVSLFIMLIGGKYIVLPWPALAALHIAVTSYRYCIIQLLAAHDGPGPAALRGSTGIDSKTEFDRTFPNNFYLSVKFDSFISGVVHLKMCQI